MSKKNLWLGQIELLSRIFQHKGFKVVFRPGEEDRVELDDFDKTVYVDSSTWPETRFYTLLHEFGHVCISENADVFEKENPLYVHASASFNDGRKQKSKKYKVSLLSEEIEAWKIGRRAAETFGFYIDKEKYDKHMTESIMSYIEWAAE